MGRIIMNFNAPVTNITVASSISTGEYVQNQIIKSQDSSSERMTDLKKNNSDLIPDEEVLKSIKKPSFKTESIPAIYDILKTRFSEKDRELLLSSLTTGDIPPSKLLFMGSGKTLLDFFKQLMSGQFLTIAVQEDLEAWIIDSFEYLHNRERKSFSAKYANSIISADTRAAKGNRLMDVKIVDGKFEIVPLKLTNREQD